MFIINVSIICILFLFVNIHSFQTRMNNRNILQSRKFSPLQFKTSQSSDSQHKFEPISFIPSSSQTENQQSISSLSVSLASLALLLTPEQALAKAGEYGIFEGKFASLLHPGTMMLLFATSFYSGILGLRFRRLREIPQLIKDLQINLPTISSGKVTSPLSEKIQFTQGELKALVGNEDNDTPARVATLKSDLALLTTAIPFDNEIIQLSTERKSLLSENLRDKHWFTGSMLLGVGVSISILGAMNTYLRTGRLFPGPHLYAGMGITILWALAASLVPEMQKGNELARNTHIALNSLNIALFAWQVVTGFDIVLKVWEKTPW